MQYNGSLQLFPSLPLFTAQLMPSNADSDKFETPKGKGFIILASPHAFTANKVAKKRLKITTSVASSLILLSFSTLKLNVNPLEAKEI